MFKQLIPAVIVLSLCGCYDISTETEDDHVSARRATPEMAMERDSAVASYAPQRKARAVGAAANNFQAPEGRQMAFTANLTLSVSDIRAAITQTRELAIRLGGYVKRQDDASASLAIPIAQANNALDDLAKIGVVKSLRINGEDVTDQATDLDIRLENLEKSRKRLLALLDKAGKVEEMVKVENEITRVTTELERLQAQRKNLKNRVDYVTMSVSFRAAETTPVVKTSAPVAWVNQLGDDLLNLNTKISYIDEALIFDLALPAGFVQSGEDTAISANNCIIDLRLYPNAITSTGWFCNDYAKLDFYIPMLEKTLAEKFQVKVEKTIRKIDDQEAVVLTVKPQIGNTDYTFRVAVAVVDDQVAVISARAKSEDFAAALPGQAWETLLDSIDF